MSLWSRSGRKRPINSPHFSANKFCTPYMPNLFERFDKKTPHYPNRFRDLIDRLSRKRAFDTSTGTEEEKFSQGKIFAN